MHSLLLAQTHIASALALLAATNDQLKPCTADQVHISDFDVRTAVNRAHNAADLVVDQLEAIHETLKFSQENGMGDDEPKIANLTKRCFVAGRNAMVSEREKLLSDIFSADGMLAEFNKRQRNSDTERAVAKKADEIARSLKEPRAVGRDVVTGEPVFDPPTIPAMVNLADFDRTAERLARATNGDLDQIKSMLARELMNHHVMVVTTVQMPIPFDETEEERMRSDRKVGLQDAPEHQRDSGDETKHEPVVINIAEGKSSATNEKIRQAVDDIKAKATAAAEPDLPSEVAQVVDMLKSLGLKVGQIHVIKGGNLPL